MSLPPPLPSESSGLMWSLAAARRHVASRLQTGGVECPCCDQFAKVYRRKLNTGMVRSLAAIFKAQQELEGVHDRNGIATHAAYVHTPTVLAGHRGEEHRLTYWRLLHQSDGSFTAGQTRGWYRVTTRGALFLQGSVSVPTHANIYAGRLLGLDGDPVRIRDLMGSHFDLQELMQA